MIPIDLSLIGIVITLILFIIFFSAIILYLAFRIKETFREERTGTTTMKILFLIGVLFLAGGGFYLFAQALQPTILPTPTTNNDGTPTLNLSISYPSEAQTNREITISFVITNPTEHTAHQAVIQTNILLQDFTVITTTHKIVGNTIEIGDIPPGTTTISLTLQTPNKTGEFNDTITLTYQEATHPTTKTITITITRRGQGKN
jgi:hypothetical protein